jgi:NADH-quinone oxidoreductase subunit H
MDLGIDLGITDWLEAYPILIALVVCAVFLVVLLTLVAYATLFERRVISRLQVRIGPNRVGPLGLFQPIADGIKLFFKEDVLPRNADRVLHRVAPAIAVASALAAFAVVPVGPTVQIASVQVPLRVSDLNVGVLYLIGVASLGVYAVVFGGWAGGSKYPLLGALRGAAQIVSYELVLGLSIASVVMVAGSMSLSDIVEWQRAHHVPLALLQPAAFVLFIIGMFAETNRPPFDLPEADTELVAGYHTEYSGFRFAMFYLAEYMSMITVSCVASTLFLGGWGGPFGIFPGPWWLVVEVTFFLFLFVWVRATIPRLRYDQLMSLAWSYLLPIAFVNAVITAIVVVWMDQP